MSKSPTKQLQNLVEHFQEEILFNPKYAHLQIQSVFIDKKEKGLRAIVIVKSKEVIPRVKRLAKKHYGGYDIKVIYRRGVPIGTATLTTGSGIRNVNSELWGTFGGIFKRDGDNKTEYGLSNNHVIANVNQAAEGDLIKYDPNLNAGWFHDHIPLKPQPEINKMDAAIFKLNSDHKAEWFDKQQPLRAIGPKLNMKVYKVGAKTGKTFGMIKAYNGSAVVKLKNKKFNFINIIAIKGIDLDFNRPGDSGSLLLTLNHHMVGLVFAKHHEYCWALPISQIKPLLV